LASFLTVLRPLLYDFPDVPHLHQIEDQVMIGPQLMIAPVTQPGVTRRLVELPPGTWYDLRTGIRRDPGPLIADALLGGIPIYVRGGSILTMGNVRQSAVEPLTELTLEAYPDAETLGQWTLIDFDCPLKKDTRLDMMYMPDAIKAAITLMEADGEQLVHRNGYNVTAMSLAPRDIATEIERHVPEFTTEQDIDHLLRVLRER
jgi:alpha-glucosidase (family GH31 glycosyl hydrolase)